jgi:hypothetical protein
LSPAKRRPPIIGRTCAFDAKIYKNVGGVFAVSAFEKKNKKKLNFRFLFGATIAFGRNSFKNGPFTGLFAH